MQASACQRTTQGARSRGINPTKPCMVSPFPASRLRQLGGGVVNARVTSWRLSGLQRAQRTQAVSHWVHATEHSHEPAPVTSDWDEVDEQQHLEMRRRFAMRMLHAMSQVTSMPKQTSQLKAMGVILAPYPMAAPATWKAMERDVVQQARAGHCPAAALRYYLEDSLIQVPPTPGQQGSHCQLARQPVGRLFRDPEINDFITSLFAHITSAWRWRSPSGLPRVLLSRYDLFHAHLFLTPIPDDQHNPASMQPDSNCPNRHASTTAIPPQGLGLVFHCQETPAFDEETFPYYLGYCQTGSNVVYDTRAFDHRNVVWFHGQLAFLDAGVGTAVHDNLLWTFTGQMRTVYESDLGQPLGDATLVVHTPTNYVTAPQSVQQQQEQLLPELTNAGDNDGNDSSISSASSYSSDDTDMDCTVSSESVSSCTDQSCVPWWHGMVMYSDPTSNVLDDGDGHACDQIMSPSIAPVPAWSMLPISNHDPCVTDGAAVPMDLRSCSQLVIVIDGDDMQGSAAVNSHTALCQFTHVCACTGLVTLLSTGCELTDST